MTPESSSAKPPRRRRMTAMAALMVASAAALAAALALVWLRLPPSPPPEPSGPKTDGPREPSPGALAGNLAEAGRMFAATEANRAHDGIKQLKSDIAHLPLADRLERLAGASGEAERETLVRRDVLFRELAILHEELLEGVRGEPDEEPAALALSRAYLAAGMRQEWTQTFDHYTNLIGARAWQAAHNAEQEAGEADRADMDARANAFFHEIVHFHNAKDWSSAIYLSDRLVAQYPRTAKAWEGLTVAARSYLESGQPAGAMTSYRMIVERCPDEPFARETAKALLRMHLHADQLDNVISQAAAARRRFQDNDFKAFSLLMEGMAHERKGEPSLPEAMRAYREAYAAKTGSPHAGEAHDKIEDLRGRAMRELELAPF